MIATVHDAGMESEQVSLRHSGRESFRRFKPVICALTAILAFVPRPFFTATWSAIAGRGRIASVLRYLYAKRLAAACGDNVMIGPRCTILHWEGLELGRNVTIHVGTYIDAQGSVSIGDDVSIAHASSLVSFEHTWDDPGKPIKYNPLRRLPIRIDDDVWIGCGVRVLAGAIINRRTVIAAGSVVLRGTYGGGVFAGVPARLKRAIA
jgi:acetyltransferase-like isoleucine patch superfamily enzyme